MESSRSNTPDIWMSFGTGISGNPSKLYTCNENMPVTTEPPTTADNEAVPVQIQSNSSLTVARSSVAPQPVHDCWFSAAQLALETAEYRGTAQSKMTHTHVKDNMSTSESERQ